MTEEKEHLNSEEYEKVGEMLLSLVAECPHRPKSIFDVPSGNGLLLDDTYDGLGIFVLTDGGRLKKKNVLGGYEAVINIRIVYQSKADSNPKRGNAQEIVNDITDWLGKIKNFPKLKNGMVITKFETVGVRAARYDATKDGYIAYGSEFVMEYRR